MKCVCEACKLQANFVYSNKKQYYNDDNNNCLPT